MEHVTRQGTPRLLDTCTLPLTAVRCVKRVYTDLAVIDVTPAGMVVREMLDDLSEADLRARTGAPLTFAPDCRPLRGSGDRAAGLSATMNFIEVNGTALRYELSGSGASTLVLIHEMGGTLESWDLVAARCSPRSGASCAMTRAAPDCRRRSAAR